MISIPVTTELPAFVETVAIDGLVYLLGFKWNDRDEAWTMDVSTSGGDPIVLGTKLVADWDLLGRYVDPRLPRGRWAAIDASGEGIRPGRFDLGDRVELIFITEAEFEALRAEQ